MSPASSTREPSDAALLAAQRLRNQIGTAVHEVRTARHWTLQRLAHAAQVSPAAVHAIESGRSVSIDTCARVSVALGLRPEFVLSDQRRSAAPARSEDPVHSAMADFQAGHFRGLGFEVAIDEPYQHYHFAGRADLLAWDVESRSLLHHENRTRFPNIQEMAGAFNAKRSYLALAIADRLGIRGGFRSVTHVMVGLWSAEVIHALRLRTETFRALCPDPVGRFDDWWAGKPPEPGLHRTLVIFDPAPATPRRPTYRGLEAIDSLRPRYSGYRDAVEALERAGRA